MPLAIPCGQCLGCRLDWSADWAARCEKEASLWAVNSFVTLTYSDEFLPRVFSPGDGVERSSVSVEAFQKFMKRLRKARAGSAAAGIRFFGGGEYGDKSERAHYHAILFNCGFPDRRIHSKAADGTPLFISEELSRLWPFGFSTIGAVNFKTAAYVARYCVKKVTGVGSEARYAAHGIEAPFMLMSRKPGIGAGWFERFSSDVYPAGRIVVGEGKERQAPRFFDEKWKAEDPDGFRSLKVRRRVEAAKRRAARELVDGRDELRARVRNDVACIRVNALKRAL